MSNFPYYIFIVALGLPGTGKSYCLFTGQVFEWQALDNQQGQKGTEFLPLTELGRPKEGLILMTRSQLERTALPEEETHGVLQESWK